MLLIEQNLGVAIEVADTIGVMVNGRIAHQLPAAELAADRDLQERLLGVRSGGHHDEDAADAAPPEPAPEDLPPATQVLTVRRAFGDGAPSLDDLAPRTVRGYNRWNAADAQAPVVDISREPPTSAPSPAGRERDGVRVGGAPSGSPLTPTLSPAGRGGSVVEFPVAASAGRAAYVAGTFDTKGRELFFLRQCLERLGLRVVTVDLATSGKPSPASVHPREVARHHPQGESAVFSGDRGGAVSAMALAFENFIRTRRDLGGLISAGGSGGTTLATTAMRALPIGVPKVMVSTMASGDTRPYVGPSDICMMYSVTDVQGINRISEKVLANAAHALAGMIAHPLPSEGAAKPALGLTMFGVTTPCVQAVTKLLADDYDCLVFHATGVGGQSMEKAGRLRPAGRRDRRVHHRDRRRDRRRTLSAGPTRLDVFARHALPYVGSVGALDMANFGAWDTVPERFKGRRLYRHNPNVTLMRTTVDENRAIGEFIATKLNAMQGPVRFLIPEGGVSAIDKPGQPFHDPEADRVLFDTIAKAVRAGPDRKLMRLPLHLNDDAFADALVAAWREVASSTASARRA